jgi:hypothetical protein
MENNSYQITEQERTFAIEHLTKTRDAFVNTIKDIDERQWYLKPGKGQWSTAECAEHILLTEVYYFMPTVNKMLSDGPDPSKLSLTAGKDGVGISVMEDRSFKAVGAPWEEVPGREIDKDNLIGTFLVKRDEVIEFVKNTKAPLRACFTDAIGLGTVDVYQFILYISAHTTRHTGQIEDILVLELHPNS